MEQGKHRLPDTSSSIELGHLQEISPMVTGQGRADVLRLFLRPLVCCTSLEEKQRSIDINLDR
jgi:hypothetical protein